MFIDLSTRLNEIRLFEIAFHPIYCPMYPLNISGYVSDIAVYAIQTGSLVFPLTILRQLDFNATQWRWPKVLGVFSIRKVHQRMGRARPYVGKHRRRYPADVDVSFPERTCPWYHMERGGNRGPGSDDELRGTSVMMVPLQCSSCLTSK